MNTGSSSAPTRVSRGWACAAGLLALCGSALGCAEDASQREQPAAAPTTTVDRVRTLTGGTFTPFDPTDPAPAEMASPVRASDSAASESYAAQPPSVEPPEPTDVTPPSIDVSGTDQTTWRAGVVPIIASARDTESGIASMTVYINEEPIYYGPGGSVAFNWDSSGYNGSMMLKVAATDGVGNTTFRWFTLNVSNRPPTVDLHTPSTVSSQVYFLCGVSGAGPTSRTVLVDGAPIDADHGWHSGTVQDGDHTLTCRATDVMGRVTDASRTFYVYNHPGGLRWIYPVLGTDTGTAAEPILEVEASVDDTDLDVAAPAARPRSS